MYERQISFPILGLIAGTRVVLGAGLGLLLADRLDSEQRRTVGWTMAAIGALTTIPLAMQVLGHACDPHSDHEESATPRMMARKHRLAAKV